MDLSPFPKIPASRTRKTPKWASNAPLGRLRNWRISSMSASPRVVSRNNSARVNHQESTTPAPPQKPWMMVHMTASPRDNIMDVLPDRRFKKAYLSDRTYIITRRYTKIRAAMTLHGYLKQDSTAHGEVPRQPERFRYGLPWCHIRN